MRNVQLRFQVVNNGESTLIRSTVANDSLGCYLCLESTRGHAMSLGVRDNHLPVAYVCAVLTRYPTPMHTLALRTRSTGTAHTTPRHRE